MPPYGGITHGIISTLQIEILFAISSFSSYDL